MYNTILFFQVLDFLEFLMSAKDPNYKPGVTNAPKTSRYLLLYAITQVENFLCWF